MAFAAPQVRKLRARLNPRHVKTREADGQVLHYVEGWHVVAEANRIFGFEGWDRETVASDCVWTKQQGSRYCAAYVARVRITVRAGETRIVREGCGVGESSALSPGQAHDFAAKAAETDATKRALMTFGNAFGLSLYGGSTCGAGVRRAPADQERGGASRASSPASNRAGGIGSEGRPTRPVVDGALHQPAPRQIMSPPPISSRATATSRASGPSTRVFWRWPSHGASATPSTSASWQASPAWSAGGHRPRRITCALPSPAP